MNPSRDNDPEKWNVLERKYLHNRPWLTVRRETLQMPDGRVVPEYYILEYPDWVNTIAITREGQFIMVKQYRPGIDATCLELCAGVREEEDASPLVSAQRELLEETGYGGGEWSEFMRISPNASAMNNFSYCFIAKNVEKIGEQSLDSSEELTVHLFTPEELEEQLVQGNIIQATMAAPLWKYMALHQQKMQR